MKLPFSPFLLRFALIVLVTQSSVRAEDDLTHYVNPWISSNLSRWFFFNAATRPEGMVSVAPDTDYNGYHYDKKSIESFSLIRGYGLVGPIFMPTTGTIDPKMDAPGWESPFIHEKEIVEAGYQKVFLEKYGLTTELTATTRVAMVRLTPDATGMVTVLFPLTHKQEEAALLEGSVRQTGNNTIEGEVLCGRRGKNGNDIFHYKIFFVAEFDHPINSVLNWGNQPISPGQAITADEAHPDGAGVRLQAEKDKPVQMKVGVSFCSLEGARLNLKTELPDWDFNRVHNEARAEWNDRLKRIEVTGATEGEKIKFYTDLFHSLLGRTIYDDVDGSYSDYMSTLLMAHDENELNPKDTNFAAPDFSAGALVVRKLPPSRNLAPLAKITASSHETQARAAADGIVGVPDKGEWISQGEAHPWVKFAWDAPTKNQPGGCL